MDNASTDETTDLLGRLRGVRSSEPEQSRFHDGAQHRRQGGARGVPAVPQQRRGADAGSIAHLLDRSRFALHRRGRRKTGVSRRPPAGSRVDHLVGRIVRGYGRGADPTAPEYNFERPVDFCSAALLITPRALFEQLGGFDERYRPAYYEDADYCVRVWRIGPFGGVRAEGRRHSLRVRQPLLPRSARSCSAGATRSSSASHAPWLAAQLPVRRQRAGGAIAPTRPAIGPRH